MSYPFDFSKIRSQRVGEALPRWMRRKLRRLARRRQYTPESSVRFEPLEPRVLLSAGAINVDLSEIDSSAAEHNVLIRAADETEIVNNETVTVQRIQVLDQTARDVMETGTVELDHGSKNIRLQNTYDNAVAIAYVATEKGGQPVNVRILNVEGDKLRLRLQEPNYLDGEHTIETVNYLVVEAGTWVLSDGTVLEAGTLESSKLTSRGFESVEFDAAFDTAPVIISQVQTRNGGDFVTTRQKDANSSGFQLAMQEEELLNSGRHVKETLGWLAIEAGGSTNGDVHWSAGHATGVNQNVTSVELGIDMGTPEHIVGGVSTYNGPDPAWARGKGSSNSGFDASVEEDQSRDDEVAHARETIDYFAFDTAGTISAVPYFEKITSFDMPTGAVSLSAGDGDDTIAIDVASFGGQAIPEIRIDGRAGADKIRLEGAGNTEWNVLSDNAGTASGSFDLIFTDVETLEGATDNEDTFVVHDLTKIDGGVIGGDGGFDSLAFVGTDAASTISVPIDANSGLIFKDGFDYVYSGLEPIDVDASDDFEFQGRLNQADDVRLSFVSGTTFNIREIGDNFENQNFNILGSTNSVFLNFGVEDTVRLVGNLALGAVDLFVKAGRVIVEAGANISGSGDVTLLAHDNYTNAISNTIFAYCGRRYFRNAGCLARSLGRY